MTLLTETNDERIGERDVVPAAQVLDVASFLDRLLQEQQAPTAVETFARFHDELAPNTRAATYRALLPASPPGPGEQYAFEVDLDRCSGCKACVIACHTLNGLDEDETWRDVGLLVGGSRALPVMQHVTAACHHCLEPACLTACPVNAYEKNPATGIVKHLDDQCFGCQYCTLACPYDVPKYHRAKGIVRKCDMCSSRLAVGEAPACVQACPHQAIAIRVVDTRQVIEDAETAVFLPAAPDPQITYPTTTYKTRRAFPRNLLPADYFRVQTQHAHWPLAIMLVLTQLSVGAFTVGMFLESLIADSDAGSLRTLHAVSSLAFGLLALGASTFHLGRPWLAFRAVLGLRHSWLSREIVAFGLFAGLACGYAAVLVLFPEFDPRLTRWLGWSVAASGALGVYCSVMIYVFTGRECWSMWRVGIKFLGTSAILGVAALWLSLLLLALVQPSRQAALFVAAHGPLLCRALLICAGAKLLWEALGFRHLLERRMTAMRRSALLMTRELPRMTLARFGAGVLGGMIMPTALLSGADSYSAPGEWVRFLVVTGVLFIACLAGELLERSLFFTACAAPRMPGGIR